MNDEEDDCEPFDAAAFTARMEAGAPYPLDTLPEAIDDIRYASLRFDGELPEDEATRLLVLAWGADPARVNRFGVFEEPPEHELAKLGKTNYARASVVQVREGLFVWSASYWCVDGGGGFAPSVWSTHPEASAEDARDAAIDWLLARLEPRPHDSQARASAAARMSSQLRAARSRVDVRSPSPSGEFRQLTLF